MNQKNLFGTDSRTETPAARRTDPVTSQVAAESVPRGSLREQFVNRLVAIGKPSTAYEIAAGNESIRKRAKECLDRGMVYLSGKRTCTRSGNLCQTYWVCEHEQGK